MKRSLHRADSFNSDFRRQFDWYLEEASEQVAKRFLEAVEKHTAIITGSSRVGSATKISQPNLGWNSTIQSRGVIS
jgi:hypothetical protein